jgi:hypothetical protein
MDLDPVNKTISIIAKRGSGKSVLCKHIVESNRHKFHKIFVVCPTENINHHYQKDGLIPKNCIFDEWNEQWALDLTKSLEKLNANKSKKEMKMVLIILDDIYGDIDAHHSKILKSIFMRSRHYGLAVISLTQTLYSLPPFARINSDYIILGQVNRASVVLASDEFLSGSLDKKEFVSLFNKSTTDHQFLIINNNSISKSDDLNLIYGIVKVPDYVG